MEGNDNAKEAKKAERKGARKEVAKDLAKEAIKKIPLTVKLYILAGLGAVVVIIIIAAAVLGLMNMFFLDYSDEVENSDVQSEYEEIWGELCDEGEEGCTEEEIAQAKELKESQQAFYDKLDTLVKNNNLTDTQRYIVLTTAFYNYDIEDFTAGNGAFEIDDTDEINYEVPEDTNVYVREKDTLEELVKQFKVEAAYCEYTHTLDNGETSTEKHALKNSEGEHYTLNFFEKFMMAIGVNPKDEEFQEAVNSCQTSYGGSIVYTVENDSDISIEAYYKYLRESTYFDDKPHLASFYADYAKYNNLSNDISTWTEEDKQEVRQGIIEDIQEMVEDYEESLGKDEETIAVTYGTKYWFPIGSSEITEKDGRLFASGDPVPTTITSPYGNRGDFHWGIDLATGYYNSPVIASMGGTVQYINNTCDSYYSPPCGYTWGNYIEILDTKGNVTRYAHLFQNSFKVKEGDTVYQGQVIAEIGNSGNSDGPHLHFEVVVNGVRVDPADYIDINNPRPVSYSDFNFNDSSYSKEEFVAHLKEYYSQSGVCNSSSSQYVNGCNSFKNEVLNNNGAEIIYDTAEKKNLNPELVVVRSIIEGFSPGTAYNYFGYACFYGSTCTSFTSFSSSMEAFFNNISQYDSVESMMQRYTPFVPYWYTFLSWSKGGCIYKNYMYPDGVPDRVEQACAHNEYYCTETNTANCTPSTQEDYEAYNRFQVSKMVEVRDAVFG